VFVYLYNCLLGNTKARRQKFQGKVKTVLGIDIMFLPHVQPGISKPQMENICHTSWNQPTYGIRVNTLNTLNTKM